VSSRKDRLREFKKYMEEVIEAANAGRRGSPVRNVAAQTTEPDVSTLYRWLRGEVWPDPDVVVSFHKQLGLDPAEALRILGWATAGPGPTEPIELPPELAALARIVRDPHTPAWRRRAIMAAVAELARTPPPSDASDVG